MPTYEYHCTRCDTNFEKVQTMLEDHESACSECEAPKEETERIFSIPASRCISDGELQQRMMGVPKERMEMTSHLVHEKIKRRKDPSNEREAISNEYHIPQKTKRK
jgi:putative FmdB family regulatory protein